jgi:hypothetical protein
LRGDVRGRRVAVVPDAVVNPPVGGHDQLSSLAEEGWGVIALCPPGLEPSAHRAWLAAIVDQVVTFLDDEYEVALVYSDLPEMEEFVTALRAVGRTVTRDLDPGRERTLPRPAAPARPAGEDRP